MKNYHQEPDLSNIYQQDALRLESVTTCVGFDDILDVTLTANHHHFDYMIVVTSHEDHRTKNVAKKHGAICVQTDLFKKNGRSFNKGAAINAGFDRFQFHGWRMHLDSDIILPDNFRRMLFTHTKLERHCLYGVDRMDVVGLHELNNLSKQPQHIWNCLLDPKHHRPIGARFICPLRGYCPLGFFQLWHASCQKGYPYSLGSAAHDDIMFCDGWAEQHRRHLPSILTYHLCANAPKWGENWEGRKSERLH